MTLCNPNAADSYGQQSGYFKSSLTTMVPHADDTLAIWSTWLGEKAARESRLTKATDEVDRQLPMLQFVLQPRAAQDGSCSTRNKRGFQCAQCSFERHALYPSSQERITIFRNTSRLGRGTCTCLCKGIDTRTPLAQQLMKLA